MTTFGTMKDRISRETQRDGLTANIADAISSAIDSYQNERFDFNFGSASVQLTASAAVMAWPAGFREIERMELSASGSTDPFVVILKDFNRVRDSVINAKTNTQRPTRFASYQRKFYFDAIADNNYNATIFFMKDLTEVSASADSSATNAWMVDGEAMIRNKAMEILYRDRIKNIKQALVHELEAEKARRKLKPALPTTDKVTPTQF